MISREERAGFDRDDLRGDDSAFGRRLDGYELRANDCFRSMNKSMLGHYSYNSFLYLVI